MMTSSGNDFPSSFMDVDTPVSEYDALPHIELPFGDKITIMDDAYLPDYDHAGSKARDKSSMHGFGALPESTDVVDGEESLEKVEEDSDAEDSDDLRPLQYARHYGLTTNYFERDPLQSAGMPTPPDSMAAEFDLADPRPGEVDRAKELTQKIENEPWDIDKETAELLTSAMALSRADEDEVDIRRMADLKIDEPVLRSDPEIDLRKLRSRNSVSASTKGLEPCKLDVQKDESLDWSAEHLQLPAATAIRIAEEKLDVDLESMQFLKGIMYPEELDQLEMIEMAIEADQSRKLRREQTPLLPLSPPLEPHAVPDEACEMPLTSSPEDLLAREAVEAEAQLFEQDSRSHTNGASSGLLNSQITSDEIQYLKKTPTTSSSSPLRQKRLRDLRAETPLLHQEPGTSPAKRTKTVSFPEELQTLIPALEPDDAMESEFARRDTEAITSALAPMAQSAVDQVNNEKLDELDTVLRLDAPAIDAVKLLPPWQEVDHERAGVSSLEAHTALLSQMQKEIPKAEKKWSGVTKTEQMLPWTPFPRHLGKVSLDEQFDDGSCERYLAELSIDDNEVQVETLLWKREGLRLLDRDDSDDEELETADIEDDAEFDEVGGPAVEPLPPPSQKPVAAPTRPGKQAAENEEYALSGMAALLHKRKLELEAASKSREAASAKKSNTTQRPEARSTINPFGSNLATVGLHGYLGLQGANPLQDHQYQQRSLPQQAVQETPPAMMPQPRMKHSSPEAPLVLPLPTMAIPEQTMSVVISSSALLNRQLVRELQKQLPRLELIERDPTALPTSAQASIGACEADFTLSPGTGLLCTTLQKLKQKPLPGQSNYFGIRERIALLSPRYERCIVLVSEGKQDDLLPIRTLDERDTAALTDLIGFVSRLESAIEISYIPGGDADLAKWVAAAICRHCRTGEVEGKLLHDETMWERLLRAAGTDPALAQVILAKLKRPEIVDADMSSSPQLGRGEAAYGLSAFVRMSVEERIQHFGPLMGGERVMARVSEVIDGGWVSVGRK